MIARIVRALRREGVAFFTVRFGFLLQRLIGYRAVLFFRVPAGHRSAASDLAVQEYRPGEVRENGTPWSLEAVSARLGEGHRMFVLSLDNRPVSFAWVTESMTFSIDELDSWVMTDQPMVWIWDCVTPDAFRGLGYYPRLLSSLIARFEVDRIVIYSQLKNHASIRGIQKAGFAPWVKVTATRWGFRIQRNGDFPGTVQVTRRIP